MSYEPYPTPPPSPYGSGPYGSGPYGGGPYGAPQGDPAVAPLRGATIGQAVARFFQRYALFRGRASRSEFWWMFLFNFVVGVVFGILIAVASAFRVVESLYDLAVIVPGIALNARRLHDTNRSGWWQLLILIPIVGWIILLVWYVTDGKPEGVRFDT